jgi:xanthine dehydrogenase accessory factor
MAMNIDGTIVGSVSGGCVEKDLIDRYSAIHKPDPHSSSSLYSGSTPIQIKYGITADMAYNFGLPCGGVLELVLEFDPDPMLLNDLVCSINDGKLVRRILNLADGNVLIQATDESSKMDFDGTYLINIFGPPYRMLLIGAGQLTEYIATMAQFCGFTVTVCDPREHYSTDQMPLGVTLSTKMPDDEVKTFRPDQKSCVIALAHDPRLDDLALLEALRTEAFYIGAIGSLRNNDKRHQRFITHFGETEQSLIKLRGPAGVYIDSKTPPEIAVSVMAEVLAVKNGVAQVRYDALHPRR